MRLRSAILLVLATVLVFPGGTLALDADVKCESDKNKTAGKYMLCRLKAVAKGVKKEEAPDFVKCEGKLSDKWAKAESKGGAECPTLGDEGTIQAQIDACTGQIATDLAPVAGCGASAACRKCEADKNKAAGKYGMCRLKAVSKGLKKREVPDFPKCEEKFSDKWAKAESKGGAECPTIGDEGLVKFQVEACAREVRDSLSTFPVCDDTTTCCAFNPCNTAGSCLTAAPVCLKHFDSGGGACIDQNSIVCGDNCGNDTDCGVNEICVQANCSGVSTCVPSSAFCSATP